MSSDVAPLTLEPIGIVARAGEDLTRVDWSGLHSEIRLHRGLGEALLGIGDYSHIIVIGWLDRIPLDLRRRWLARPAGDDRYPLQGSLALRGGARPNPISVTVCRLIAVEGDTVQLEGLDLVDGTPVIDIKPYIAHYDAVPHATLPRWAGG